MPSTPVSRPSRRWKILFRLFLGLVVFLFLAFEGLAFSQAWSLTHYAPVDTRTTRIREIHTWMDRARLLLLGPKIRRMANIRTPAEYQLPYSTTTFVNAYGKHLEAWYIPGQSGRPTVLLFPGYAGSKDTLLAAAVEFHSAGYGAWLIDFAGIGGSEGQTTTVGWCEAEDVAAAAQAFRAVSPQGPLVFYGTSMGAAAILCANQRGLITPDAVILECPFDRFSTTIGNRLRLAGLPATPLAQNIVFWVGAQNGFNGLAHNPVEYARSIRCPALLMQGENDEFVGLKAAHDIATSLGDHGTLKIFPKCGHAFLVRDADTAWRASVREFLAPIGNSNQL